MSFIQNLDFGKTRMPLERRQRSTMARISGPYVVPSSEELRVPNKNCLIAVLLSRGFRPETDFGKNDSERASQE